MFRFLVRKYQRKTYKLCVRSLSRFFTYEADEDDFRWYHRLVLKLASFPSEGFRHRRVRSALELSKPVANLAPAQDYQSSSPQRVGDDVVVHAGSFPPIQACHLKNIAASAFSSSFLKPKAIYIPDYYIGKKGPVIADGNMLFWYGSHGEGLVHEGPRHPQPKGIKVFGMGANNWYHWLLDILPSAYLAQSLPDRFKTYPLIVPQAALDMPQFRESVELFKGTRELIGIDTELYDFEDLISIDPILHEPINMRPGYWPETSDYSFNPRVLMAYRQDILDKLDISEPSGPTRLFLARGNDRRPYNQDELLSIAEAHGFEAVYPELLSFREQVALFAGARFIMGPSGAAFANSLFCSPGCRLLSWLVPQYSGFCSYSNIASTVGTELRYLFGHHSTPIHSTFDAFRATYTIDVAEFETALDRMLNAEDF
jgi:hypothetical protein